MPLSDFVQVTVTKVGGSVTRQGFGTPAFVNDNAVQSALAAWNTYADIGEIETAGFTSADQFHKWATLAFAQVPAPNLVASIFADIGGIESFSDGLTRAIGTNDSDFYWVAIDSRLDIDILAFNVTIATTKKQYIAQTDDADLLAGTALNIGEDLRLASAVRTSLWYHSDDTEFMDGAICGVGGAADLDQPGGVITFALQQLQTITPATLTTTEAANIQAENANFYESVGGRNVTNGGTVSEGEFIDVQSTLDWTEFRNREGFFRALSTIGTKVPYTTEGIALIAAEMESVNSAGVINGHYASDATEADGTKLPRVITPSIEDILQADKDARILRGIEGRAVLAGAIHQVIASVRVTA